ncbi:hypothetical protein BC826DRAFT_970844 [Russula brevipes]|nr:hypothetical protein BC826DRAFT_970844 [Russula brevipes]
MDSFTLVNDLSTWLTSETYGGSSTPASDVPIDTEHHVDIAPPQVQSIPLLKKKTAILGPHLLPRRCPSPATVPHLQALESELHNPDSRGASAPPLSTDPQSTKPHAITDDPAGYPIDPCLARLQTSRTALLSALSTVAAAATAASSSTCPRHGGTLTRAQVTTFLTWAKSIRTDQTLLGVVARGCVVQFMPPYALGTPACQGGRILSHSRMELDQR